MIKLKNYENLRDWNWRISASVGVIYDSIEGLIEPLPEDGLRSCSKQKTQN